MKTRAFNQVVNSALALLCGTKKDVISDVQKGMIADQKSAIV